MPGPSPAWTNPVRKDLIFGRGSSPMAHFFYTVVSAQRRIRDLYRVVGFCDRRRLLPDLSNATYVTAPGEGGRLLREGTLMVQGFDAVKLQLAGEPIPVVEQVQYDGMWVYGSMGFQRAECWSTWW